MTRGRLLAAAVLLMLPIFSTSYGAAPDDDVEWDGISHVPWQDRRPLCPVDGESFEVRFQTFADDITSARVHVDDGTGAWIVAAKTAARGPYDIWTAQIPSTGSAALSYYIELRDGSDTDYLSAAGMSDDPPVSGWYELNFETLEHAPLGSTPMSGGGAVFKVWSPSSATVHVRGEFNGWGLTNPMAKVGDHFVARIANASDRQMYKYFFDGTHWNTDARAKSLNPSDNYNAHIEDPFRYAWAVEDFDTPDFGKMVIYQLHVGTFAGRNDPYGSAPFPSGYADVAARAAHLAELGVNAVMLNPITEFPGDYSAGYNPVSQWAPEWKYGQPDDLKHMVDVLHQHGIAVLLDIVWNHFSFTDNFLWYYDGTQIYFDDPAVGTPWGDQADFDSEDVRDYFAESALYWLEEYKVDGFRMDATSYMNIYPQEAAGWSLMQRMNDEVDNRWIDKITMAEQLPDNSWVTRPTALGGAGFDSQYHDAFTDRLREEIFDAAYGDPEMWKIRDIINGSGEYLEGRYVTNYLELHDEAWPSSGGQRIVKSIDPTYPHDDLWAKGRVKLGQGVVMTAPGIPAMLMGSEWLEDTDFGTDESNRIDWSKKSTYSEIFAYFRDLVALRRTNDALRADAGCEVFHLDETDNVIAWERWSDAGDAVVIVANFSNTDRAGYRIGLPRAGDWVEALNSQATRYGGNGVTNSGTVTSEAMPYDGFAQSATIDVAQMALIVLASGPESSVPNEAVLAPPGPTLVGAFPNPFNPTTGVVFELPHRERVRLSVYDVAGRHVRELAHGTYPGGRNTVSWDGKDESGRGVAAGVYFLRLIAEGRVCTKSMALVK